MKDGDGVLPMVKGLIIDWVVLECKLVVFCGPHKNTFGIYI